MYTAVNPLYNANGPSRWMMRRAVPNGPRGATTVFPPVVVVAAAVVAAEVDEAEVVVVATTGVVDNGTIRCCHPTSCNAFGMDRAVIAAAVEVVVVPEEAMVGFTRTVVLGGTALGTLTFVVVVVVAIAPSPPPEAVDAAAEVVRWSAPPLPFPATSLILLILLLPKARPFNVF